MPSGFQSLKRAISGAAPAGGYRWGELLADLWPALSSPLTAQGEHLLLEILRFEGRIQIDLSSEIPHSMPPEDMLKSLAIQGLARWTGLAHLHEMQRIQLTTLSSSLSSLVRDVIQKARESQPTVQRITNIEEIMESGSEAVFKTVFRPLEKDPTGGMVEVTTEESVFKTVFRLLEKDRGMSFIPGRRFRVPDQELKLVC